MALSFLKEYFLFLLSQVLPGEHDLQKVKLEQKLASMMTELGSQLKQAEETNVRTSSALTHSGAYSLGTSNLKFKKSFPSQLPLKRKKRQAKKSDEEAKSQAPRQGDLDDAVLMMMMILMMWC